MKFDTQVISMEDKETWNESIELAAGILQQGEIVGIPTETVYGLGANALNGDAVDKIFLAKGRPSDNPLIVHISKMEELQPLAAEIPPLAQPLMEAFWPGPLTIILPKSHIVPYNTTAGLDTVAIRMPSHPVARALIEKCRLPIAAPSANRSGRPSPTTAQHVYNDMDGRIPLILDGGKAQVGVESTVVDMTGSSPIILRPGGITREMLEKVIGKVDVDASILNPLKEKERARSPGMKYIHYAPRAKVIIVSGNTEQMIRKVNDLYLQYSTEGKKVGIMATEETKNGYTDKNIKVMGLRKNPDTIAANLFMQFREFDEEGMDIILAEAVPTVNMGLAVMNRMGRAAGFHILEV